MYLVISIFLVKYINFYILAFLMKYNNSFGFHFIYLNLFIVALYLDYEDLSREPENLFFCLIRSLIFNIILVWKHFNFLTRPCAHFLIVIMYVEVKSIKFTNIFLACLVGPVFVEDATKFLE